MCKKVEHQSKSHEVSTAQITVECTNWLDQAGIEISSVQRTPIEHCAERVGLAAFFNGTVRLAPNSSDISGFECCDWIGTATNDPSVKTTDRIIEFHLSCVAFVFHHSLTSAVHHESPINTKIFLNSRKNLYRVWQKIPQFDGRQVRIRGKIC